MVTHAGVVSGDTDTKECLTTMPVSTTLFAFATLSKKNPGSGHNTAILDHLSYCQTAVLNRARKSWGDLEAVHSAQIAERHHASGAPTNGRWSIAKNTPNITILV